MFLLWNIFYSYNNQMGNRLEECVQQNYRPKQDQDQIQFINYVPTIKKTLNFEKQSTFNNISNAAQQFCISKFGIKYYNLNSQFFQEPISKLLACNQIHIFEAFKSLPNNFKQNFVKSLLELPIYLMDNLYNHHINRKNLNYSRVSNRTIKNYNPVPIMKLSEIRNYEVLSIRYTGLKFLQEQKVGIIILMTSCWEAEFPLTKDNKNGVIEENKERYVLRVILEKLYFNIQAKSTEYDPLAFKEKEYKIEIIKTIPIVVVCTKNNKKIIEKQFQNKNYFGFNPQYIVFQEIKHIPLMSQDGKFCLNSSYEILEKPEGTSNCLDFLFDSQSQTFKLFHQFNIKYLHCLGANNLSEIPANPLLLGLIQNLKAEILANCLEGSFSETIRTKSLSRYAIAKNRAYLLNSKEMQQAFTDEEIMKCPIALDSMIFDFSWLNNLKQNGKEIVLLANKYNMSVVQRDYYDFELKRQISNQKFYAFGKDIRDYISTSKNIIFAQHSSDNLIIESSLSQTNAHSKKNNFPQNIKKYK